ARTMKMKRKYAPITTLIITFALLASMCAGLTFSQRTSAQSNSLRVNDSVSDYPVLSKYATDLTKLAVAGKLEISREHESDIARDIASLSSAAKNAAVDAESDLDRDAIARGGSSNIAFANVSDG